VNATPPFRERLDRVLERIAAAARRAGRDPGEVMLVGVVKGVSLDAIREGVACGLADLGENRVQEARMVIEALGRSVVRWHMVGHLQRNKAAEAVGHFDRIHGLDRLALAEAVSRRAVEAGRRLPATVQVNIGGEATKQGVAPGDAAELVRRAAVLPGLAVDGLMAMAPWAVDPEASRPHFARTRALRDGIARETGIDLPELSMGMSGDYEVAVEEGSTMVRIGTALFGLRSRG
jgi:hypothetical protein